MNKNLSVRFKSFQLKRVEKWLELEPEQRKHKCPFGKLNNQHSHALCEKVFPDMNFDISGKRYRRECPCTLYDVVSVSQVARELVRRTRNEWLSNSLPPNVGRKRPK